LVTANVSASAAADPTEEKYVEVEDVWPAVETDGAEPNLRVLVPTRDEAASVLEFVRRERALTGEAEIVFVGTKLPRSFAKRFARRRSRSG
jgi:hypothetical protein